VTSPSEVAQLFQEHRDELGFVNSAQCEAKTLKTTMWEGTLAGALLGNHCVRKPQSTIYELAVLPEYRRRGIATELVERFAANSPHEKLVAKCPTELDATAYYERTGWHRVTTESGKSRTLAVYEYPTND